MAGKKLSRDGVCDYPECGKPISARRLCDGHYKMQRRGEPLRPLKTQAPAGACDIVDGRKCCTKCSTWRSVDEFNRSRSSRTGFSPHCRECTKRAHREYGQANKDKVLESARQYRAKNRKPRKTQSREGFCDYPECGRDIYAKRLCEGHYDQQRRGKPLGPLRIKRPRNAPGIVDSRKLCTKCREWKSIEHFNSNRSNSDGLHAWCKECGSEHQREYREKNREKTREANRRWRERNPDWAAKRNARMPPCEFPDCDYAARAVGLCSGHYKQLKRGEELHALRSKLPNGARAENPELVRAINRHYNSLRRARELEATIVPFTREQLAAKWAYYGNRCWLCSAPATQTDHVKPLSRGGAHALANMRPICTGCNMSKGAKWPILALRVVIGINYDWP